MAVEGGRRDIKCIHLPRTNRSQASAFPYLKHPDDFGRKLHQRRAGDAPIDPIDKDTGPDGVRHRAEFGFLVRFLACRRQLPGEGGRQPLAHLRRYCVRLHLRKLIVFVSQAPVVCWEQ